MRRLTLLSSTWHTISTGDLDFVHEQYLPVFEILGVHWFSAILRHRVVVLRLQDMKHSPNL